MSEILTFNNKCQLLSGKMTFAKASVEDGLVQLSTGQEILVAAILVVVQK